MPGEYACKPGLSGNKLHGTGHGRYGQGQFQVCRHKRVLHDQAIEHAEVRACNQPGRVERMVGVFGWSSTSSIILPVFCTKRFGSFASRIVVLKTKYASKRCSVV